MSSNEDQFLWAERYRPQKISDCVLPERIKSVFQQYVDNKNIPNLMLTGTAGVGKTTVALAMCKELGLSHMFINSSEDRGIDILRTKIRNYASTVSVKGGRKVIILDEADYITPEAQAGLRGAIEEYSENCSFIFTCNFKSKLIDALHSRCAVIDFTLKSEEKPKMAFHLFERIQDILNKEGVEYDKKVLVKIVEKFFPDFRRTINELQRYGNGGSIDAGVLSQISNITDISALVAHLKNKDFSGMRKWVATNSDADPSKVFRAIYDGMYSFFKPDSIPQAVVTIAKYQYQAAFVADQEINLVACLTEIMVECEYT